MISVKKWIDEKIESGYIRNFNYNEFSSIEKIGEGAFGIVNKANLANTGLVALKIIISKNSDEPDEVDKELVNEEILFRDYIKGGGREEPIKGTPTEYQKLYQECWSDEPKSRPNIEKVHEILSELSKNSKEPSDQLSHPINIDDDDFTISSRQIITVQDKESAEKENISQAQFTYLQNVKQALTGNLTEQQDSTKKITNLKEASQDQSALTNFQMGDNNMNQLIEDIKNLHFKLKSYVTALKGDYDSEIDFDAVNNLMEMYGIKARIKSENPKKLLIKAVLQYHVITKLTRDITDYLKENSNEDPTMHLEAEIASKAADLENRLAYFSKTRSEKDVATQAASIKIRQEINIALGNRGFSDILRNENDKAQEHAFISKNKNELNKEMNKYRVIKDKTKGNYVENLAPDLIREFIRIFLFRLNIQEPSVQMRFIKIGSNVNPNIMEGNWDKEDIDNLEVEVCSFPMIGQYLDDVEKRKIYIHAQVLTKEK
ncbi:unnamed protein product [Rhizophagus irregularis]|nr:unnamed protein product [Rhizophagus irregularis]